MSLLDRHNKSEWIDDLLAIIRGLRMSKFTIQEAIDWCCENYPRISHEWIVRHVNKVYNG
jgi:hypothetical protein